MPRFLSAQPDARLITLPWDTPLADWPAEMLVALPRGISRHVVRFVRVGSEVYALKEVLEHLALHEYRLLRDLVRIDIPSVEANGVVLSRFDPDGEPLDPVLITKHLQFSLPYRSLFSRGVRQDTVNRLVDAMVVLLARLHLSGFLWGDVSLSNTLFRRDAGSFAAYLVDAETGELHESLSDGQREHDLSIARTNLFGEFCDLEAGGLLDQSLEPLILVETIENRYRELWGELTGVEEFDGSEMHRIESRVRRLNALGFDVAELDITTDFAGSTIRIQPKVVDAGHHSRRLLRLTGLDTEENQARRLLNDLDYYRARTDQQNADEAVVAHQWLTQLFEPVVSSVPPGMRAKLEPAEFYHEVLEHRWYSSERAGREIDVHDAAQSYISTVLHQLPDEALAVSTEDTLAGLANPFDPSMGFADADDGQPYDPWEDGDEAPAAGAEPAEDFLDIAALRARTDKPTLRS
ncbi:MAG: DUF4032 domain-containing protein [Microlunatus sp.]|nr:DUF4032 domain-containing protein [Microlunatus sp.]MDN5770110.1 DUF4032 domain-containing protein [Microlunatus sp.]MDN5803148.1 DUF4032 domain-containing protein [Microlunatus sp.]